MSVGGIDLDLCLFLEKQLYDRRNRHVIRCNDNFVNIMFNVKVIKKISLIDIIKICEVRHELVEQCFDIGSETLREFINVEDARCP